MGFPMSRGKLNEVLDEVEERLQQLAIAAQHHSPHSLERKQAIGELMSQLLKEGKLCRPYAGGFSGYYEDIYSEALENLWVYISKHIDKYDPMQATALAWINMLFKRRFFRDAIPKVLKEPSERLPLADIENLQPALPEATPPLSVLLREIIETDPDNLFKQAHVEHYPNATFQAIALRWLSGVSWKSIAEEFDLTLSTVSSFYTRSLKKFAPKLKEYCHCYYS